MGEQNLKPSKPNTLSIGRSSLLPLVTAKKHFFNNGNNVYIISCKVYTTIVFIITNIAVIRLPVANEHDSHGVEKLKITVILFFAKKKITVIDYPGIGAKVSC